LEPWILSTQTSPLLSDGGATWGASEAAAVFAGTVAMFDGDSLLVAQPLNVIASRSAVAIASCARLTGKEKNWL
jgi:hypothetical protein